ncbi:unnamed protein product [Urochloa decumbens]|uniref:NAD-dependent epimerase/dehydratase domain-containing protein n=1 Tax=Urochloa decumbens TaxID=240449 RepID=A0ABC9EB93_9POAL
MALRPPHFPSGAVPTSTSMEETKSSSNGVRVCVTGGAGFIGSWLVKKLLQKGYTVHATLRNTGDEEKTGLLRRLVPGAAESGRLLLFEADLYDAATFAPAIAGCQFVFLVATPFQHDAASTKYKSTAEAALGAARVILRQCSDAGTVRRVIHTGSISACSPLTEDSTGFKDAIDESCWTPLNVYYPLRTAQHHEYILSKVASEKELLAYNAGESLPKCCGCCVRTVLQHPRWPSPAFEVVTLACSVVDTLLSDGASVSRVVSPVTRDASRFGALRMAQRLAGSVPLVHVDDVCNALVFCMERPSMAGRFLCAAAYPTITDIVGHFAAKYPHLELLRETETLPSVQAHSDKLGELGFR